MEADNQERIQNATEALLSQGFLSSEPDPAIRVGEPIPVLHPNSAQHSWFVPLVAGSKLAGFAELLPSLTPLRVSSFQRQARVYEDCPEVSDWTDPDRIRSRAQSFARQDEQLSTPVLTYDVDPSRLAWKILATSPSGNTRVLFVAGTVVYESHNTSGIG
jgi:hypothetical protein